LTISSRPSIAVCLANTLISKGFRGLLRIGWRVWDVYVGRMNYFIKPFACCGKAQPVAVVPARIILFL